MPKVASLNIRLDAELKKTAEAIYARYGLSLAEAVSVFLHHSCNVGGLPFELRPGRPNAQTLAAMAEAEHLAADASAQGFRDMDALFKHLDESD